jgi:hypothetical protein
MNPKLVAAKERLRLDDLRPQAVAFTGTASSASMAGATWCARRSRTRPGTFAGMAITPMVSSPCRGVKPNSAMTTAISAASRTRLNASRPT